MKKIVLLLSLVLCAAVSFAQSGYVNTTTTGSATTLFKSKGYLGSDSAFILLQNVADTTTANFSGASLYNGAFIRVGTSIYYRTLSPKKWNLFATGSIPDQFNPTAGYAITLSGTYPNITFTVDTGLVVPYTDTLKLYGIATKSNVNLKLNISDTAAMLSNLLRKSDTLTMLNGYARTGNVVPNTRTINTNAPLVGGGDLSSDRTFLIDTGRANAEVVTGGSLNKVRDSLQANITASVSGVSNVSGTGALSFANPTTTPVGTIDTSWSGGLTTRLRTRQIADSLQNNIDAKGTGTVTSIATINGILGGTITTTGTLQVDSSAYSTKAYVLKIASDTSTSLRTLINTKGTGNGTVTSVAAGTGMSFTTITTTGNVNADTSVLSTKAYVLKVASDTSTSLRTLINTKGTGNGTVTSVGLSMPSIFSVSGSPVTTSGTLTTTLANQNANLVFASPTTGSPAQPTFRSLVIADIPDLSSVYLPIIDTATMLSNRLKISDTASMLRTYFKNIYLSNFFSASKTWVADGNSITQGSNASVFDSSYVPRVADSLGFTYIDRAIGGSVTRNVVYRAYLNDSTQDVNTNYSVAIGVNDLGNTSVNTISGIINGLNAIVANRFADTIIAASNLNQTGTWSTLTTTDELSSKSQLRSIGNPLKTTLSGSKLSKSITISTGQTPFIGTWGDTTTTNLGVFSVKVDGIIHGHFYPQNAGNSYYYTSIAPAFNWRVPCVYVINGLSAGTHTIDIESLTNDEVDIDYLGIMKTPDSTSDMLIGSILKSAYSGYIVAGGNSNDQRVDSANRAIDSLIAYYNNLGYYRLGLVETNVFYSTSNSNDGLHPDNAGHKQVADAFIDKIKIMRNGYYYTGMDGIYVNYDNRISGKELADRIDTKVSGSGTANTRYAKWSLTNTNLGNGILQEISNQVVIDSSNLRIDAKNYGNNGLTRYYGTDGNEKLQIGAVSNTAANIYGFNDINVYANGVQRIGISTAIDFFDAELNTTNVLKTRGVQYNSSSLGSNGLARWYNPSNVEKMQMGLESSTAGYIYASSGQQLKIYSGGSESMVFDSTNQIKISTSPTTSSGSYDLLSRNSSNGFIEKISSTTFLTNSNVSGTTGYLSKFTASNTIGNSLLSETGTELSLNDANLRMLTSSAGNRGLVRFYNTSNVEKWQMGGAGDFLLYGIGSDAFNLYTKGSLALNIDSNQIATYSDTVKALSFVRSGGTPTQSLIADGSVLTVASANTSSAIVQRDGSGNFSANNISINHLIGTSGSLSTTGLGTNVSSMTVSGTDLGMTVTVVTSGSVAGTIGTVNFNTAFGANPHVVISCADITTGAATSSLAANATGTGTYIIAGNISGAGTYVYNVIVIQ